MAHIPARTPVVCSDHEANNPDYQTAREVSVEDMMARPPSRDLDADAERVRQSATPPQPTRRPPPPADTDNITISGPNSTIICRGVTQNLQPGTTLQIGHTNYLTLGADGYSSQFTASQPRKIGNKRNITESQAEPTHEHFDIVSRDIGGDWQRLGRELKVLAPTLEQIRLDNYMNGIYETNYQMLRKWKESNPSGTVRDLALALATMERGDIADHLSDISSK